MRFVHTNIVAQDWRRLSLFYQRVFGCRPVPPERDLKGQWLDRLTGISDVHISGEHLLLPGYGETLPTLEIFSYNFSEELQVRSLNQPGLAHLAFEVDDVEIVLEKIKQEGGGQVGEIVRTEYPGNIMATFVYGTDMEGNIIELQSWKR